jgi:hypothetical protein
MVLYLTAATLDQGYHDRNPLFSALLQHPSTTDILIENLCSVPYCSILDQGNNDRNPWFNIFLQHHSITEIMIETLGSVP